MRRGGRICLCVAAALLLIALLPLYLWLRLRSGFTEQTAAERWQGSNEARFCQVTCFLDESVGIAPEREYSIRQELEAALAGESDERWVLAFSGTSAINVTYADTTVSARGIYIAGDFSHFHPMQLAGGSWFDSQEINRDGVVVDMELAWKLFGGYDLQGMSIYLNGIPVQITGVARKPELGIEQDIYGQTPTLWFSAGLLERLGIEAELTCIEAVLPNPVTHFAAQQLSKVLGSGGNTDEVLENTGRFGFLKSLQTFLRPDERVVRTSRVTYPYWENAARVGESRCGIFTAAIVLLLLFPAALCVFWFIRGYAALGKKLRAFLKRRR